MQNPNGNFENNDLNNIPGSQNQEHHFNGLQSNPNEQLLKRNQQGELSNNLMEESMEIQTMANEKPGATRGVVPKRRPQVPVSTSNSNQQTATTDKDDLDEKVITLLWQLFFRAESNKPGSMHNAEQLLSLLSDHLTSPDKKPKDFLGSSTNLTKPAVSSYGR